MSFDNQPEVENPLSTWVRMWSETASKMTAAWAPLGTEGTTPAGARKARSAVLQAWAECWDQWVRSTEFLGATNQAAAGMAQLRRQYRDFLGQLRHELEGATADDVKQLAAAVQQLQRQVAELSDSMSARLDKLSEQLASRETSFGHEASDERQYSQPQSA